MRLNSIQFFTSASMMMSIMFIPLLAEEMGATYTQVGIIMSVYGACLFFSSYIFSKAADVWNIKKLLLFGLACSAIAYFLQIFAYDPLGLALVRGFLGICVGMYPAAFIMHVYGLKRSIGKFSSFGALGWAFGFFGAGLIGDFDLIFLVSSFMVILSLIIAIRMPEVQLDKIKVNYFSFSTIKNNWSIYLAFFIRHTGAVGCWTIFPLYMVSLGADMFWIGLLFAVNPLVQFLTMRRLDGWNMELVVKAGYLLSILAFISLVPATIYYHIIPSMFLVALSWSFLFVGSTELLLMRNKDKATSAGYINSVIAMSMITGPLLGGILSGMFGFTAMFIVAAGLSLVSLLISLTSLTHRPVQD
ncbi:MAG: MFS transporter [ANME-2 cluster archaeon]|nr:MFS transporter [ANME-2 cluster archaeon]MBC2702030.1 MFS transporter [ANME-2 cluster archaeon]MBC2706645.1 MFS transporter [ANME-2 cluster archaeon]MBC2748740.1 MFS transporter [ANME-2 cluster archaeon]MBC2762052.1 MFS transporter [ANME-2 cluster archaeon]